MTTKAFSVTELRCGAPQLDPNVPGKLFAWDVMSEGDVGEAIDFATLVKYRNRAFQVAGEFGAGGELVLEGTNDEKNWETMLDPRGVPLHITWAGIYEIEQTVMQIRPRVSEGDEQTRLVVTALLS